MEKEKVEHLLSMCNGNQSVFYPILKDRLSCYKEQEVPFPQEFLFFEDRYLIIKKDMIEHGINNDVVDIGCQFGFQSELFLDNTSYLGIDAYKPTHFMNSELPHVNYIVGVFPTETDVDLRGKTVISSMSLGYFDSMIEDDKEEARKKVVDNLKHAKTLYIASVKDLIEQLRPYFSEVEVLDEKEHGDYDLYAMRKEGD